MACLVVRLEQVQGVYVPGGVQGVRGSPERGLAGETGSSSMSTQSDDGPGAGGGAGSGGGKRKLGAALRGLFHRGRRQKGKQLLGDRWALLAAAAFGPCPPPVV